MTLRWARSLPEASATIACQGEWHRVRLHRGKLRLDHHDLAGEAALAALGGSPTPCFAVLLAWRGATPSSVAGLGPDLEPVRALGLIAAAERAWARDSGPGPAHYVTSTTQNRAEVELQRWLGSTGEPSRTPVVLRCRVLPPGAGPPMLEAGYESGSLVVECWVRTDWLRRVWLRGARRSDDAFVLDADATSVLVARLHDGRVQVDEEPMAAW